MNAADHKTLLDCAEAASAHDLTRRLFAVLFEAAQAQRRVELFMLVHRFDPRAIDIPRTHADEWDRMTVRLIEQEARKIESGSSAAERLQRAYQQLEQGAPTEHDGWSSVRPLGGEEAAHVAK